MEKHIQWTFPDRYYSAHSSKCQRDFQLVLLRAIFFTLVTGAIGIFVIWKIYPNLPTKTYSAMWKGTLFFAVFTFAIYILVPIECWIRKLWPAARSRYELTDYGVGRPDNKRSWKRFCAFAIEPHPDIEGLTQLVLFAKRGMHVRLPMPEGVKAEFIARFAARHLPLLEEMDDPESIATKLVVPPTRFLWLIGSLNILYAVALGYLAKSWFAGDVIKLVWMTTFIINPATFAVIAGWWSGWCRRKRIEGAGWWLAFSLMSWFSFWIGVILGL